MGNSELAFCFSSLQKNCSPPLPQNKDTQLKDLHNNSLLFCRGINENKRWGGVKFCFLKVWLTLVQVSAGDKSYTQLYYPCGNLYTVYIYIHTSADARGEQTYTYTQIHAQRHTQKKWVDFGAAAGVKSVFLFSAVQPAVFHLLPCILLIITPPPHTHTRFDLK